MKKIKRLDLLIPACGVGAFMIAMYVLTFFDIMYRIFKDIKISIIIELMVSFYVGKYVVDKLFYYCYKNHIDDEDD